MNSNGILVALKFFADSVKTKCTRLPLWRSSLPPHQAPSPAATTLSQKDVFVRPQQSTTMSIIMKLPIPLNHVQLMLQV